MSEAAGGTAEAPKVRRLSDVMRKVRVAEAERVDARYELHEAEQARLMLLAEGLESIGAELSTDDYFLLQLSEGMPPRYWVDPTSHVVIGRDRRTYRFLKDTRLGRTVIRETPDAEAMADCVAQYVAERVLERERALESDWMRQRLAEAAEPRPVSRPPSRGAALAWSIFAFLVGLLAGAAGLVAYAWFRVPPL